MSPTSEPPYPYRDPALAIEKRVEDLLGRLTLEEKAGQLTQYFYMGAVSDLLEDSGAMSPEEKRDFAAQTRTVEAAIKSGRAGGVLLDKDPARIRRLQRLAVEGTRHGIPLLVGFDVIHGLHTIFPVPIALAATWSPQTAEAAQSVAAREARAAGIHWTFGPMVDIARDPRWGRIVEGSGEDPTLGAAMAAAQVRGFQGDLGPTRVLAGPKHFIGYGAARGGRDYEDVELSDSELWNVFLPPFRAAIDAGAKNVMSAYMDLNGVPASGNRWLLHTLLREELGFDGFTVSDANAVRSLVTQHLSRDLTDAAARAITAGLDIEMASKEPAFDRLPQAVTGGLVAEGVIDEAVRRVLGVKFRLGLFEQPYPHELEDDPIRAATEGLRIANMAAEQAITLLKNDGALPLDAGALGTIAVIGELAASGRDTLGPWMFEHEISEISTVLDGLCARLGDVRVEFTPGAGIPGRIQPSIFDPLDMTLASTPAEHDDDLEIKRAIALAANADIAIVVVGQRQNHIGECASVANLDLPGRQLEQLQRIVATGTPVVLVLMTGRPLDLRWAAENVPAIVQAWYPGVRGGDALARVLLGDSSPAGRLPFTWPRHVGQVPMIYAHHRTFAPENAGARYIDESSSTPLYSFGHGLSYATFEYGNLTIDPPVMALGESTTVSVEVTNTSSREADEVVQLYIHQRYGTSSRPVRELKGFHRLTIPAGRTRTVRFELGPQQLIYWSAATRGYVQDASTFDIWVGGSSSADLAAAVEVIPHLTPPKK